MFSHTIEYPFRRVARLLDAGYTGKITISFYGKHWKQITTRGVLEDE
jgi:hypothetical protein